MPDPPLEKRPRLGHILSTSHRAPPADYAELHCLTNFSFLRGASHADELLARAAELGYRALAVTDIETLSGVVRAHTAAKQAGVPLIVGAEVHPRDAAPLVLWAPNRAAYGRLSRLLTTGRRRVAKGQCELSFADLVENHEGLLAGVLLTSRGQVAPSELLRYRDLFGDRCYGLIELHRGPDDRQQLEHWWSLARQARVPLVAANDVHYHEPHRQRLQDVLVAIREGCTVAEAAGHLFPNAERYLKSPQQMASQYARYPELIHRTGEIASRCEFSLEELRYEYPEELCPPGHTLNSYLGEITWRGAEERFPNGVPMKVCELIDHELSLIAELEYEAYFLTVYDLVKFARSRNILCQGRGSAANSVVCFCLGITSVDPSRIDVLFERFISRERNEAPDIDVDFEHQRRDEVLQYLYQKYSRERAGMTAEVITYRPRSAVRDVGKALGLSLGRVDALAKLLGYQLTDVNELAAGCREAGLDPASGVTQQLLTLVPEILGFPRHLSQHVGGMVMTRGPLCELVPIENAAMPGRTVIQWDKDDLDDLGILKVDCLALGMLSAIHRAFDLVEKHERRSLDLATVPAEDPQVYDMICKADTVGVFQIESRAQMTMLPRLRPRRFYDLVIEVAIVRPGPIQGKMVHPYLKRRNGQEPVTYPNHDIQEVLEKTLGVPLFQEQAMRLAVVAAGFTPGEADQLRRAMAAWRRPGLIDGFHRKLIKGMLERGLTEEFAERIFQQLQGFGQYGFPESHAASFALLVYVSAWLKCHQPAAFTAALLNSQPMGFYAPAQLIRDARNHGVKVYPVDVNSSEWDCTLEPVETATEGVSEQEPVPHRWAIRLGMNLVRGFSPGAAESIVNARSAAAFTSWEDFLRRTDLGRGLLIRLARADAFRSLGLNRRDALWQMLSQEAERPLFAGRDQPEPPPELPVMSLGEEITADYHTAGLSLRAHPISLLRSGLDAEDIIRCEELARLAHNRPVRVAGLVLFRQRPSTAKGITFMTLEDETGIANLIIRPEVWEQHHRVARRAQTMVAAGRLQRQESVIHILVTELGDLSAQLAGINNRSRDFR